METNCILCQCHAIYLSKNQVQHKHTKDIKINIHFVRVKVAIGWILVLYSLLAAQYTDIFIKGLPSIMFLDCCDGLNICGRSPVELTLQGGGGVVSMIVNRDNAIKALKFSQNIWFYHFVYFRFIKTENLQLFFSFTIFFIKALMFEINVGS